MSDNNNNLIGEVFGEQSVIGSLGVDVKIIYRGYTAYIDELYVDDDGDLIIALTNSQGESTTVNAGHVEGEQGDPGYVFIPSVSDAGVISWTNAGGLPNPDPKNIKGQTGDDGVSPEVTATRLSDGVRITITDADGTTTAKVDDGFSPIVMTIPEEGGNLLSITDSVSTKRIHIKDGYHVGDVRRTSGSTLPGQTATYTMYLNDKDETSVGTFSVYNGADGEGVGDMTKAVYDTNDDGVVDNASALGGHPASYFAAVEDIPTVPTNVSAFTNDAGYITTETDPTVPSWAKQPVKPTYTASEVGAATVADIPTNVSELTNDAEYITAEDVPDIVPAWAMESTKPTYTATEVGADISGSAAAVQTNLDAVAAKIPAQATAQNQLADKNFVNSSIENIAAYFITVDAAGNPFATKAALTAATTFYSGGVERVPTRNDYTVVLADESKTIAATGEKPTTRYMYNNGWQFQYIVNNSGLTAAQWAAVNSNITDGKVSSYDTHVANNDIHVTASQKSEWSAKQNAPLLATSLPSSGTALADNTIYTVSSSVGTYKFTPPANGGWAHGVFTTGSSVNITFSSDSKFVPQKPTFSASTTYEFDVNANMWVFAKVVTS